MVVKAAIFVADAKHGIPGCLCLAAWLHPADARRDESHAIGLLDVRSYGAGLSVLSEDIWPMGDFDRPSGGGDAGACCNGQQEEGSEYRRAECADGTSVLDRSARSSGFRNL